ncbi:chemokine (C-X-C motif) ligand 18b [Clarias gariepinus]|uniref:chemokine (C-X-C motif) ligand 18b n=1 Tax=Clarias gariepinus TaxID=13013 RepID=UPI00234C81AC|nr:chemokine (C-X-C motif) ligand 18b [Clarias gariepinus]
MANMAFITYAVSFSLVVVFCIQQNNGQSVPDRCRCLNTSRKPSKWKNIEEFSITPPRSRCKVTEIILTLKTINPKTKQNDQRCISPEINQSVYLQECWNRVNKDGKSATVRMIECGNPRNSDTKVTENATTVSTVSAQSS